MHADWLIPNWPAPANVRAVFTTRQGGVSEVPWDSLNLGDHVGDAAASVAANRQWFQQSMGVRAVFLKQVHETAVLRLEADTPDGLTADACLTTEKKLACTIMVADCLPVLLAAEDGSVVAAAHAGWRGLAGAASAESAGNSQKTGVLASIYESFSAARAIQSARPAIKTIAWLGPCIGPTAFEVGAEVKAAFEESQTGAGRFFAPAANGKYLADLAGLARERLHALGITAVYGNDSSDAWCTVLNAGKYFSHRRDAGPSGNGFNTTGRMAACIWRD